MSYYVHIAREGFKETPIPLDDWLAAARQCDELAVEENRNRHGEIKGYSVYLKGNKRAKLLRHPSAGVITAQDPSKELIIVMFKLAGILNVGVYSDRLKKYESVDDWEKRTKKYRQNRDNHHAEYETKRKIRNQYGIAIWVIFIVFIILTTWVLTPSNNAYWFIIVFLILLTIITTQLLNHFTSKIK